MITDRNLCFTYANTAYLNSTHRTLDAILGEYIFDVFPDEPERVSAVMTKFERALSGEVTQLDAQPFQLELEDGTVREVVWEATQEPVRNAAGEIVGMIQRAEDITKRYELEQRNRAISYELNHRVKNVMAVVSSIARITGRKTVTVKDFVKEFTARINSMSRTHDQLARGDWAGLTVSEIFREELTPYSGDGETAFTLEGPDVRLSIEATKDLSMLSHELTTNAAKYGCFSSPGGRLSVVWTRKDDSLNIIWTEKCEHKIEEPKESGFGTRLFDLLPYVNLERDFTSTGLHLAITMDGDTVFG